MSNDANRSDLRRLTELVARLRGPEGCPWDREQELADLRPYLLEEAHEAAAAVDSGDWSRIREELGDLLFQVAFISRLGEEDGAITVDEVVDGIERKMIDRHPHVFGGEPLADAKAVREAWEKGKSRRQSGSILAGVPETLPSLVRAYRVGQKAAGVGFDWESADPVFAKLREEIDELSEACGQPEPVSARVREELGDVLFTVANLARHLAIDPEAALHEASRKFQRRFEKVEERLEADSRSLADAGLEKLDALWQEVKSAESRDSSS